MGSLLTLWREWLKSKRNLGNIKDILSKEMKHNYLLIISHMPHKKNLSEAQVSIPKIYADLLAGVANELPSSVYEKYLDRLAELSTEEMDKIYNAYTHIKQCVDMGRQTIQRRQDDSATVEDIMGLIKYCEAALESISIALLLFEDGEESLDILQKERGKQLEAADEYIEQIGEK